MRWLYRFSFRLRSLVTRRKVDQNLSSELQGRETSRMNWLENTVQDLHFAWRGIRKSPGFTIVVVITLGLGIGANTAMFSLLNAVLLKPLHFAEPQRLVGIWNMNFPKGGLVEFGQRLQSMELAAFADGASFNLNANGEATRISASTISVNLFSMLGVRPALGRLFAPGDEKPGQSRLVLLSHNVWQTKFGGDPHIVGRSIVLDDVPREIVGVMPSGFRFPTAESQLWVPLEMNLANRNSLWGAFGLTLIGRLRPGIKLSNAQAEFKSVVPQAVKAYPWPMGDKYGYTA